MKVLILLSSSLLTLMSATSKTETINNDLACTEVECYEPVTTPEDQIIFIDEEVVDLGFDTRTYLPENFDPYASEFEGKEWIDEADLAEIDLGFDTEAYLPKGFDPYASVAAIK